MKNYTITPELIRTALGYLSPDVPRQEWSKVAMSLKSEFDDSTGFELFDSWSQGSESYQAASSKTTWRSVKASGGISIGTLLKLAQDAGFDVPKLPSDAPKPSAAQVAALAAEKRATAQREQERTEAAQLAAAAKALKRWQAASESPPEGMPTYLTRKAVQSYGLRFEDSTALIPLRDGDGKLWNLQALAPRKPPEGSDKLFMKGRVAGLWHMLDAVPKQLDSEQKQALPGIESAQAATIFIAEGYATAATVHEATGLPVACAFNAGNLTKVATELRKLYPAARLIIAGDDDRDTQTTTGRNAGREAADKAAKAVQGLAVLPTGLQDDESDWNDVHARLGIDAVREQLMSAIESAAPKGDTVSPFADDAKTNGANKHPSLGCLESSEGAAQDSATAREQAPHEDDRFVVDKSGVYFLKVDDQGKRRAVKLCSPLHVVADTQDLQGNNCGLLLEFPNKQGRIRSWPMPASMLAGSGDSYRAALLSLGLRIEPGAPARNLLTTYIQSRQPTALVRCTDRAGWYKTEEGRAVYVQPGYTYGDSPEHRVIFQSETAMENTFSKAGTLDQWQRNVAALCLGNSRLAFSVSCSFAAMAMSWVGSEGGGFHLRGFSSTGKTTALWLAGSVFGGLSYKKSWNTTEAAIEATAAQHSDALLTLDEIKEVDPKFAGKISYMLGNGQGRARRGQHAGIGKPPLRWKLLFLSTGELSLAQHMASVDMKTFAGQEVRMADIPAEVAPDTLFERMHGIDHLSGKEAGAAFAKSIEESCARWHGTAAPAFIEHLIANQVGLSARLKNAVDDLAGQMIPEAASGQVHRVGWRFALVAAAGELATQAGITGWPEGEATQAARKCFEAWLSARGGLGNLEQGQMLGQVRNFLQLHGGGRFTWWHRAADDHAPNTLSRAGYKRMVNDDGKPVKSNAEHQRAFGERMGDADAQGVATEYFIFPEVFDKEVCQGFDAKAVKRLLRDLGHLHAESDTRYERKERLPGIGNTRVIKIKPSILEGDAD